MEGKSARIELRLEPTIKRKLRVLCERLDVPMNKYIGDLILGDLRRRGDLTEHDIRQMREG